MDSGMIYPSSIWGWTGYRNLYLLIASNLRSKVLLKSRVVHRYRHGVYRSIWAILWASRTMFKPYPYPSDSCVRNNRYLIRSQKIGSVQSYQNPTDCIELDRVLRRTEGAENTEIRKEKKRIQVTSFVFKSIQAI